MYRIERTDYGFHLTFSGHVSQAEIIRWLQESRQHLLVVDKPFGVFVDMRRMMILPPESRDGMNEGQQLYRRSGMERSVVIHADDVTVRQFSIIAKETGIYEWERYIDASSVHNWEEVGLAWIRDGVEPEQHNTPAASPKSHSVTDA